VGRHFGVHKLWMHQLEIDVALPRSEKKSGLGHCAFDITTDPNLSPQRATLRRYFTINAMMFNPLTGELLDFHAGEIDLKNKTLRHISPAFSEDPLRPLRAMQFAARFRLKLEQETALLCADLLKEAGTLSSERIWQEWRKWSHAAFPSFGLQALNDSGWLQLYPELLAMRGCPQNPRWHPEGDVWTHTLLVCDQAALIASHNDLDNQNREQLLFSALCHDFGKPACTSLAKSGEIISPGHSEAGIVPSGQFLQAIGAPGRLLEQVQPLVREHITHLHSEPTPRATRRLAHRLEPANIELWEMLVAADASGRSPAPASRPALNWLQQAHKQQHHQQKPIAILTGKMLLTLGASPGPNMGDILDRAYHAQLDGDISDEKSAIAWYQKNKH
ncbi:MAG: HD domain-containing protein, partial [Mariprofundus sp.]